jgi:enolase-phosphatase E1
VLTCIRIEAEAADDAGVHAVLVDRPGNAALDADARERFAVVQRLTDLP